MMAFVRRNKLNKLVKIRNRRKISKKTPRRQTLVNKSTVSQELPQMKPHALNILQIIKLNGWSTILWSIKR